MNKFFIIVWKEIHHIKRDRRTGVIIFVFPVIMTFLYGYAISFDIKNIPTGVVNFSGTTDAMEFMLELSSSDYFTLTPYSSVDSLTEGLVSGRIKCGIVIPPDFIMGDRLTHPQVQILIDGSDANLANKIIKVINSFFMPSKIKVRFIYNREMKSRNFFIPGILVTLTTILGVVISSHSIVREKEKGNFELLYTTPVSKTTLITGKLLPYGVIALIDVFLITGFAVWVFHVPFRGSLFALFLNAILFLIPIMGLGGALSAFSRTELTALTSSFILVLLPSIILSGFVFPVENMPYWLQWITKFIPATHFLKVVRGIFLKGVNIFPEETLWLLGLGILYLLLAWAGLKKRLE